MFRALRHTQSAGIVAAVLGAALLTAVLAPFQSNVGLLNEGLLFLLLTLVISSTWGRRVGLAAAVITNLALNFFFIEPLHTFAVADLQNIIGLGIFLAVSVLGSTLLVTARNSAAQARRQQAQTEAMFGLTRAMTGHTDPQAALEALCQEVVKIFAAPGASVLRRISDEWLVLAHAGSENASRSPTTEERAMADRAVQQGAYQGVGGTGLERSRRRRIVARPRMATRSQPSSVAVVPLVVGGITCGVLRVDGPVGETPFGSQARQLLQTFAGEAAVAVQRIELAQAAAGAEALKQADEMKAALLASISHDLKTPLASIKAAVSNLLDKTISWCDDDVEAFHRAIDTQADRLDRVINDILDLNRIESGALTPDQAPVEALQLLQTARNIMEPDSAGHELTVHAPAGLCLVTDESLTTQALVNLIENAVKYSRPGGAIRLLAARVGDYIELSVEDEGPGIFPEDLPFVFERFYRAGEHSRRVKGSGLGLTIVKGFVELCGGRVFAQSSPDGARFVIRFAAAPAQAVPA